MSRAPRIDYIGARHHVMNRGARRSAIFFDDTCYSEFLNLLGELPKRYDVRIHGYALMPNHFHILMETGAGNLSRAVGFLCGQYAQKLNRKYEWDGPLFKGRFHNRVVEDTEYWRHLLAYVHMNPLRAGLVARLEMSNWTSHAAYTGRESCPEWLFRDEMMELFGTVEAYVDYHRALHIGRIEAPEGFEQAALWIETSSRAQSQDYRRPSHPSQQATIETAMVELKQVTGLSKKKLLESGYGRHGNRARWIVVWWLRYKDRITGRNVARYLGVDPTRISQMLSRAISTRETDEQLDTWMTNLEKAARYPVLTPRKAKR